MSIVFQEPVLDEELTGKENLAFHTHLYSQRKAVRDERINEVFGLVGLSEQRNIPVSTYSGDETVAKDQLGAVARAVYA